MNDPSVVKQVMDLQDMPFPDLNVKYRELFGKEPPSVSSCPSPGNAREGARRSCYPTPPMQADRPKRSRRPWSLPLREPTCGRGGSTRGHTATPKSWRRILAWIRLSCGGYCGWGCCRPRLWMDRLMAVGQTFRCRFCFHGNSQSCGRNRRTDTPKADPSRILVTTGFNHPPALFIPVSPTHHSQPGTENLCPVT